MLELPRLVRVLRTVTVALLLLVFAWMVWHAGRFRAGADLFPQIMGVAGLLLCVVELMRQALARRRPGGGAHVASTADLSLEAEDQTWAGYRRALVLFGWLAGYGALILLLGMPVATLLFVPLFVRRFGASWYIGFGIGIGLVLLMIVLRLSLHLQWPRGWVPWPW